MEMCYAGAIAMPSSYVVMNEEEMTYTEGGGIWGWLSDKLNPRKTSNLSIYIDAAFIVISAGISIHNIKAYRNFIVTNQAFVVERIKKDLFKYVGSIATTLISSVVDLALTITGNSIGSIIAEALDRADGCNDNYVSLGQ